MRRLLENGLSGLWFKMRRLLALFFGKPFAFQIYIKTFFQKILINLFSSSLLSLQIRLNIHMHFFYLFLTRGYPKKRKVSYDILYFIKVFFRLPRKIAFRFLNEISITMKILIIPSELVFICYDDFDSIGIVTYSVQRPTKFFILLKVIIKNQ